MDGVMALWPVMKPTELQENCSVCHQEYNPMAGEEQKAILWVQGTLLVCKFCLVGFDRL